MTPNKFYERLQTVTESSVTTLSPGPLSIKVNEHDAMAAKLLLWLQDQMPDDAIVKDLFDVLDAAKWWATFWTSLSHSTENEQSSDLRQADKVPEVL